ncbi:MAG TPA: rhomboid family intramembrane serine protease [Bacteroidia bacterium]|nr:rhomboid family intramembrane serine protease [Bacteroidia bacterium]
MVKEEQDEQTLTNAEPGTKKHFLRSITLPAIFVSVLWIIELIQQYLGIRLLSLGILPGKIEGLSGIITSPFVHSGFDHLISNSLPILIVGSGLFYFYPTLARPVILMTWLFTGVWVWLAGRTAAHIGASGLIYGFVCFLFFSGILRKDTRLIAISLLVTFLYGSLVWGILPVDQSVSWESHFFGAIAGTIGAIYYRKDGPQRPKAQWELDEEEEKVENFENDLERVIDNDQKNNEQNSSEEPMKITYIFKPNGDEKQADKGF